MDFPGGASGKEPACQCRRYKSHGFDPWIRKIPWRRACQPTPVFSPGESPWTEEPGGLQSTGSQRVGHNWATKHSTIQQDAFITNLTPTFLIPLTNSWWQYHDILENYLPFSFPLRSCSFPGWKGRHILKIGLVNKRVFIQTVTLNSFVLMGWNM